MKDQNLYNQGKNAVATLVRIRQRGSYRVIRDPAGVVSLWTIEGSERGAVEITFADQGHISRSIEKMSPDFVRSFISYVNRL